MKCHLQNSFRCVRDWKWHFTKFYIIKGETNRKYLNGIVLYSWPDNKFTQIVDKSCGGLTGYRLINRNKNSYWSPPIAQTVTVVQLRNALCVELRRLWSLLRRLWMAGLHRTGRPAGQSPWRRLSHPIGDPISRPYWYRLEKLLMRLFLLILRSNGKHLIRRAWTLKLHFVFQFSSNFSLNI